MMGERREGRKLDLDLGLGFPGLRLSTVVKHEGHDPYPELQPLRLSSRSRVSAGDDGKSRQLKEGAMSSKSIDDSHNNSGGSADSGGNARKKLRLSDEQTSLLEESFRWNNILNTLQKQELAEQLNLRPRQVEVWFQNRRARTKVKQTEMDCRTLRKWCASLSNENQRLRQELHDLRLSAASANSDPSTSSSPSKTAPPLALCHACNTIIHSGSTDDGNGSSNNSTASSSDVMAEAEMLELKLYG